MTKKTLVLITLAILIISIPNIIANTPVLVQDASIDHEIKTCDKVTTHEKIFVANAFNYYLGLECPMNSSVTLFHCQDSECDYKKELYTGHKIEGIIPHFSNFESGETYLYECGRCTEPITQYQEILTSPPTSRSSDLWWLYLLMAFVVGAIVGSIVTNPKELKTKHPYHRHYCPNDGTAMKRGGMLKHGPRGGKEPVYYCPTCHIKHMF